MRVRRACAGLRGPPAVRLWHALFGAQRRVRNLNRDAAGIIAADRGAYPPPHLAAIAAHVAKTLTESRQAIARDSASRAVVLAQLRQLHREARRAHDQVRLSAITLAIIYLESEPHGDACRPARQAIEDFMNEWGEREGAQSQLDA